MYVPLLLSNPIINYLHPFALFLDSLHLRVLFTVQMLPDAGLPKQMKAEVLCYSHKL